VPLPTREAIYAWFIKHLKQGQGDPREAPVELDPPENLLCTPTGQVSDSLGGETVFTLNRKRAADLMARKQRISTSADVQQLRARLQKDIREVAAVAVQPGGAAPEVRVHGIADRVGYRIETVSFPSDTLRVPGLLLVPEGQGAKRALVVVDSRPKQTLVAPGGDLEDLVTAGYLVFVIQPRGVPETPPAASSSLISDYELAFRAAVVGKTLLGMRAEDVMRAVDYLISRPDVDRTRIDGFGQGTLGVVMLHAAILDDRIQRIFLQETLALYRMAVERPIHRNIHEQSPARVLRKYDLDDLLAALSPRRITIINPVDALGQPLRLAELRKEAQYAFDADKTLGQANRIDVRHRDRRARLPALMAK
jgi:hypothetical protein